MLTQVVALLKLIYQQQVTMIAQLAILVKEVKSPTKIVLTLGKPVPKKESNG